MNDFEVKTEAKFCPLTKEQCKLNKCQWWTVDTHMQPKKDPLNPNEKRTFIDVGDCAIHYVGKAM